MSPRLAKRLRYFFHGERSLDTQPTQCDVLTMQNFQINFPQDFGNWRFPQDWWIQRKSSLRNSTVWNPQLLPTAALL